jgi:hypothetical protein
MMQEDRARSRIDAVLGADADWNRPETIV